MTVLISAPPVKLGVIPIIKMQLAALYVDLGATPPQKPLPLVIVFVLWGNFRHVLAPSQVGIAKSVLKWLSWSLQAVTTTHSAPSLFSTLSSRCSLSLYGAGKWLSKGVCILKGTALCDESEVAKRAAKGSVTFLNSAAAGVKNIDLALDYDYDDHDQMDLGMENAYPGGVKGGKDDLVGARSQRWTDNPLHRKMSSVSPFTSTSTSTSIHQRDEESAAAATGAEFESQPLLEKKMESMDERFMALFAEQKARADSLEMLVRQYLPQIDLPSPQTSGTSTSSSTTAGGESTLPPGQV